MPLYVTRDKDGNVLSSHFVGDQVAEATASANAATIRAQALTALSNNIAYLAVVGPTNAQVVAQVRALTQQMDGVIRLLINRLDATN